MVWEAKPHPYNALMDGIRLTTDTGEIDWVALRQALIDDRFDNGRTAHEYEASARGSHRNVYALLDQEIVGNARVLSDGVCNAYIVDVWTRSDLRRRGIGAAMIRLLLQACEGQHVHLVTEDQRAFYAEIGFSVEEIGMSQVVGSWLRRAC